MLPIYDRPGAAYLKNSQQQVVFEGLYVSLGFNSGEFLLEQVEEILYNPSNVRRGRRVINQTLYLGQRRDSGHFHGHDCKCASRQCRVH